MTLKLPPQVPCAIGLSASRELRPKSALGLACPGNGGSGVPLPDATACVIVVVAPPVPILATELIGCAMFEVMGEVAVPCDLMVDAPVGRRTAGV